MDAPDTYQRELKIDADPATVFAFFTDPQRLMRWVGVSADLEPRPGGLFLLDVDGGHVARGEFKEVVPVSRLAYSFGWQDRADFPPGSSLVEVDLTPTNGSTVVRFKHSGMPPADVPSHTSGWNHYLDRLILAASGRDPGPDPRRQPAR